MTRTIPLLLVTAILAFSARPAQAQLPHVASYQGYLELSGEKVNNASATMDFGIYLTAESGSPVWTEQHLNVPVEDGVFAVLLGSVNTVGFQALPFGEPLWLGSAYEGGEELSPRTPLVAAPYSLHARSINGLRVIETTEEDAPSILAGHDANDIVAGVDGATISGGGYHGGTTDIWPNSIEADYGTIGGGRNNRVTEFGGTIGGGTANIASGLRATVGGGRDNLARGSFATVAGGASNEAGDQDGTTVAGGWSNAATGEASTVSGGNHNTVGGSTSTIAGGVSNDIAGDLSTIGGGGQNIVNGSWSVIAGGYNNKIDGDDSTIPGGYGNRAGGNFSFAAGANAKAIHEGSFVWSDASQSFSDSLRTTGINQFLIRAAGGIGIGTNTPTADVHITGDSNGSHPLLFLQETGLGDYARLRLQNSDALAEYWDIAAGGTNTGRLNFFTRDHNVVSFWPHHIDNINLITTSVGAVLTQGGVWQNNSSRASKIDFELLDTDEILEQVAELPISQWRYKVEPESVRHVGPVAEDFYAAFGLGTDDTTIGTVDVDGVALAAIQGLYELVKKQQKQIEGLTHEVLRLRSSAAVK